VKIEPPPPDSLKATNAEVAELREAITKLSARVEAVAELVAETSDQLVSVTTVLETLGNELGQRAPEVEDLSDAQDDSH
jgi:ABC-type transporter Mla subunit MlaD